MMVGFAWLTIAASLTGCLNAQDKFSPDFFDETEVTALFAFADVSIPFTQNLKDVMRSPEHHLAVWIRRPGRSMGAVINLGQISLQCP